MDRRLLIGAHMSISGGVFNAILAGEELGCTTIQIFTKNNNQWKTRELSQTEVNQFFQDQERTKISPIVGHNGYLINLASPKDDVFTLSKESMLVELQRAERLGLPYLVMHPGSHLATGEKEGLKKIAGAINWLHQKTEGYKVKICLETTAGQGSNLGYKFEQLAEIIEMVKDNQRLGICYDTCHAFAAGYDMGTKKAYQNTFKEFDKVIGLSRLKAMHLNDAVKDLDSRVDRHTHIGEGKIGLEGFRLLMNDERWEKIPKILETPKEGGTAKDIKNLRVLRNLVR